MNELCVECKGKCCQGIIDVYSQDEIFYDEELTCENDYPDRQMQVDENNKCIALKNGRCSIYKKRPLVCREFQVGNQRCINFFTGHLNAHGCFPCPVSERVKEL